MPARKDPRQDEHRTKAELVAELRRLRRRLAAVEAEAGGKSGLPARSDALMREALDTLPEGFVLYDRDDRFVVCNARFRDLYAEIDDLLRPGVSFRTIVEAWIRRRCPHVDTQPTAALIRKRIERHLRPCGPFFIHHHDGRSIRIEEHRLSGGQTVGLHADVSELKQAESALRQRDALLRSIVDNSPVVITLKDLQGRYVMVNEAFEKLRGVRREEALGKTARDVVDRATADLLASQDRHVLRTGETVTTENETRRADGTIIHQVWTKFPVYDGEGTLVGVGTVATEDTALHRARQEIVHLNASLERRVAERTRALEAAQERLMSKERLAAVGQLGAMVSHELRNPLGTIRASIFSLDRKLRGRGLGVEETLARAERAINRCGAIIEGMLELSRGGGPTLTPTRFDSWLAGVLLEYAMPRHVRLDRRLMAGDPEIELDQERFRRVVVNLLDNAVQAIAEMPTEGLRRHRILVASERDRARLRLRVRDTGPGVPADAVPHLFEPMYSTKGFGIGLGLSIVKRIVEMHQGEVAVNSAAEEGAEIVVSLPIGRDRRGAHA